MKCIICEKEHKNKKYCSELCQYEAYRVKKVERILVKCLNCNKEFEKLITKKNKYCSRKCSDEHKKITYLGENNPMFGKNVSDETKLKHSEIAKKLWKNPEIVFKIKNGMKDHNENSEYPNGWSIESREKRKITQKNIYGNLIKNEEIKDRRDKTCLDRYGMTSSELWVKFSLKGFDTKIEKIFEKYLIEIELKYKKQYKLYFEDSGKIRYKIYDFYLSDKNLLVEIDGDYWHGNPIFFEKLNKNQIKNKNNDLFKDELAKLNNMNIIRIWENEINENRYKDKLDIWIK